MRSGWDGDGAGDVEDSDELLVVPGAGDGVAGGAACVCAVFGLGAVAGDEGLLDLAAAGRFAVEVLAEEAVLAVDAGFDADAVFEFEEAADESSDEEAADWGAGGCAVGAAETGFLAV